MAQRVQVMTADPPEETTETKDASDHEREEEEKLELERTDISLVGLESVSDSGLQRKRWQGVGER